MGAFNKKQQFATGVLTLLLLSGQATAQITPGQVTDTLKKSPELRQPQSLTPVERQNPQQSPVPSTGGKTVQISKFEFSGNTAFSETQLAAVIADYLNRPIKLSDLYGAADRISDYYAENGYTLASVNVPPQKISGGAVRLEVNEGVIGQVSFEGNKRHKAALLSEYLGAVKSGRIYQGADLESGMQRLNELPGLKARAVVKPGSDYGTTDLIIKTEEKPVSGSLFVDNYGTQAIGEMRVAANLILNNPSGIEDQLNILALRSENNLLAYGSVGYSLPLNFRGSRLHLTYGQADFEVPASAEGISRNGKIAIEHPVLRSQRDRLDISAGVSRTNSEAFINGTNILVSGTSITLLELGTTYNHVYGNAAVTQVAANLASNFDKAETALEARPVAAKAQQADQRLRLEIDAQHLQPLRRDLFAQIRVNGVYSPDPLSNVTQYSIGGPQSIRGYPSSEVRGDRGYFGQFTFGRNFRIGAAQITGRAFADSGRVFCAVPAADCTRESLSSVGFGADLQYDRIALKLDQSFVRDSHVVSDGENNGRLFGSLFVSF